MHLEIGYCTTFKLGDKVKPITEDEDYPIMTVCAIQLNNSQNGIKELFQVDLFENGNFMDKWVEAHQIKGIE